MWVLEFLWYYQIRSDLREKVGCVFRKLKMSSGLVFLKRSFRLLGWYFAWVCLKLSQFKRTCLTVRGTLYNLSVLGGGLPFVAVAIFLELWQMKSLAYKWSIDFRRETVCYSINFDKKYYQWSNATLGFAYFLRVLDRIICYVFEFGKFGLLGNVL